MLKKLRIVARDLKRNFNVYRLALQDPRTPRIAKILLAIAVGYTLLPIDIIPDFIPVLGQIDDLVIIPALIQLALAFIPDEVMDDCRLKVAAATAAPRKRFGRRSRR